MPIKKTMKTFGRKLRVLHDRVSELQITVAEDQPPEHDAEIVDKFKYAVDDLDECIQKAIAAAEEVERAAGHPVDVGRASRSLVECQEQVRRIERIMTDRLTSYEHLRDLTSYANSRRGEWPAWVRSVKRGVEHCRHSLHEATSRLVECWQEIAEQAGSAPVSVQTFGIGYVGVPGGKAANRPNAGVASEESLKGEEYGQRI